MHDLFHKKIVLTNNKYNTGLETSYYSLHDVYDSLIYKLSAFFSVQVHSQ